MTLSRRDFPQILQSVYDDATKALRVEGDITVSNPSVGPNGSTAPTSSDQVAGQDPSGNLQPLQTDAAGDLKVLSVGGSLTPFAYDYLNITYINSGNGAGQPGTIQYYVGGSGGTLVKTMTVTYNASNNPLTVTVA